MKEKRQRKAAQKQPSPDVEERGIPLDQENHGQQRGDIIALHRARMLDWAPSAATALAATSDGTVLAAARESGAIELWTTDHWFQAATLSGSRDMALTSLAWLQEPTTGQWRLFSGGLDGLLTEWDIPGRQPLQRIDALGGAVWAIAARPPSAGLPSSIAVACDDGCLRLFEVEEGEPGLSYRSSLPHLEGRLLSVAWHPAGKIAVVGTSRGTVHAWDVESKREILRIQTVAHTVCVNVGLGITLRKALTGYLNSVGDERQRHQDVWALTVLPDGSFVTGDSGGNLQVWDATHGTLVAGFRQHQADILAVAASLDGSTIFASGSDPQVSIFQAVQASQGLQQWEYLQSKRPHSHDVRAFAVVAQAQRGALLVSCGNDARLFAYRIDAFTKEHPTLLSKAPEAPHFQVAEQPADSGSPLLLCTQQDSCVLWQLGISHSFEDKSGKVAEGHEVPLSSAPRQIAEVSSSGRNLITFSALSPDGRHLVLGDSEGLQLFRLSPTPGENGLLSLQQIKLKVKSSNTFVAAAFAGGKLLLSSPQGLISVFDGQNFELVGEIGTFAPGRRRGSSAADQLAQHVTSLEGAIGGKFALLRRALDVHVIGVEDLKYAGVIRTPQGDTPITAASFSPDASHIALSTASNGLALYSTESRQPADLPEGLAEAIRAKLKALPGSIKGISFLPGEQRLAAVASTSSHLCHVDFLAATQPPPAKKRRRRMRGPGEISEAPGQNLRIIFLEHICLAYFFGPKKSAILIEKDWTLVQRTFPPPIFRHRFGT